MKISIRLPAVVESEDHHDFWPLEWYLGDLNEKIRVKNLGIYGGYYLGIIYVGSLKSAKNKAAIKRGIKKVYERCERESKV